MRLLKRLSIGLFADRAHQPIRKRVKSMSKRSASVFLAVSGKHHTRLDIECKTTVLSSSSSQGLVWLVHGLQTYADFSTRFLAIPSDNWWFCLIADSCAWFHSFSNWSRRRKLYWMKMLWTSYYRINSLLISISSVQLIWSYFLQTWPCFTNKGKKGALAMSQAISGTHYSSNGLLSIW